MKDLLLASLLLLLYVGTAGAMDSCPVQIEQAMKTMDKFVKDRGYRYQNYNYRDEWSCNKDCLQKRLADINGREQWEKELKEADGKWDAVKRYCWKENK